MNHSTSKSGYQILDIRDKKTRDIARGLLDRKDESNIEATFSHLMKTAPADDFVTVDDILRKSGLFAHLKFRSEFPMLEAPFTASRDLVIMPTPELRPAYIVHRANMSSSQLAEALDLIAKLNEVIFSEDDTPRFSVPECIASIGHSLLIARKLAFIFGYAKKDSFGWKMASEILASYGSDSNNYGIMAVVDSIGFDFSYLGLKANFEEYISLDEKFNLTNKIAYLSFKPLELDKKIALEGIAANYAISLLDAVHYVLCHRELGTFEPEIQFCEEIEAAWKRLRLVSLNYGVFFDRTKIDADLQAFRAAPAFLEDDRLRNLRISTQFLFDFAATRSTELSAPNAFEADFYCPVKGIRDLLTTGVRAYEPAPIAFDTSTAGNLTRSCGLVRIVERDPDFSQLSRDEMVSLMGQTTELDKLLSITTLREAASSAADPLVKLFLETLLRAHSPATKDSFRFKQSFQKFVLDEHRGDVVSFLREIYAKSIEVIDYFVTLLDETMLSQMPFLVEKAEDVYETRARILEWHGDTFGEDASHKKAKQLRIDRKIASVRGQINETRLNIDPIRFRQWIEASRLSEFSAFVRQDKPTLPDSINVLSKKIAELRLGAHRDPNLRAIVAVMECYREFCTNADFGVASYLGRRIRHGTLRGTLLDGLPNPSEYELTQGILNQYQRWLRTFEDSTNAIASKLHFVGKGSSARAVISPEIDSREKAEVVLICLGKIFETAQADQGVIGIPLIIEQYCWYIFEMELREVQTAVLQSRAEFGSFTLRGGTGEFAEVAFEKDVNIALSNQFSTVASWFKKPPNISPVAEVGDIVNVVLREARAEYSSYKPKLVFHSGENLELSGLVYYQVYDALSIVVRNAAKHGAHPGAITIAARTEDRERGTLLHLEIATKVKETDSAGQAVERMEAAGKAGPENADVVEGLSGMRKLQKMKLDNSILNFHVSVPCDAEGFVVVSVIVALSGLV